MFPDSTISNHIVCDICDQSFNSITERNKHIENHFKVIDCPNCNRQFVGDRAFEYHTSFSKCKHKVNQTKFRCNLCNEKVFDSKQKLAEHEIKEHNCAIDSSQIICETCNKIFGRIKYLKKHILEVHSKKTQFYCDSCGKNFNRKSNLTEHMLIHENKYLAKCETCGKQYRTPSALRLHIRMHTGEKPYTCDLCSEKSYAYNTDLTRHKRNVHGVMGKQFPCTVCSKIYYERKLLNYHMRKHHLLPKEMAKIY